MRRFAIGLSIIVALATPVWASQFADDFEGCTDAGTCQSGTAWDAQNDADADMTCADGAGDPFFEGTKSCELIVDNATLAYVDEDGDAALGTEADIWIRFYLYLKANTDYVASNNFQIMTWRTEDDSDAPGDVRLIQAADGARWSTDAMVENDDNTQTRVTGEDFLVANRWYCIEYYMQKASTSTANDGIMRYYVNNRLQGEVLTADNNGDNVGDVRLGAPGGLDAGTTDLVLYVDSVVIDDTNVRPGCIGLAALTAPEIQFRGGE